jgi:hypothetical protein
MMDTGYGLRGRCEPFYLHWRSIADRRMQAGAIVETFDEAKDFISRGLVALLPNFGPPTVPQPTVARSDRGT